jgi:hypothetical protein
MSKPELFRTISDEAAHFQLQSLIQNMPDLLHLDDEGRRWLGRVMALVEELLSVVDVSELRSSINQLSSPRFAPHSVGSIKTILFRALGQAELGLPVQQQGSFLPAGDTFDAFTVISKILKSAQSDVLIVDPYMDHAVLEEFAPAAPERVRLRLLSDTQSVKPSLAPAVAKWSAQYGQTQPLEARLAAARTLHDRLILVDAKDAWIATQSFAHFAARSPASIQRFSGDNSRMKIDAYERLWREAQPLGS